MIKKNKILVLVGALGIALLSTIGCNNTKKVDNNTIQENETEDKSNNEDEKKEENNLSEDEKRIFDGEVIVYEAKEAGTLCELDLDRDGTKEDIQVSKLETDENNVKKFDIIVNDSKVTFEQENGEYLVVALAFDDKSILLSTFTYGVSDDPVSVFYKYDGKKLEEVGYIANDIRDANKEIEGTKPVVIKGNTLKCITHAGTLSNYVYMNYKWNGDKLESTDNEEYDYVNQQEEIRPIKDLTIYENKLEKDSKSTVIKAGTIIYPLRAAEEGWNYIRTEDGDDGWLPVFECYDSFDRLNLAG